MQEDRRRPRYTVFVREDLRHAVRLLYRRPGISALVVAALALGIAATTVVFSLADAILWHPMPFRDAGRLVRVRVSSRGGPLPVSAAAEAGASALEGVYPFQLDSAIVRVGSEPRAVTIGEISPGLIHALGVAPMWGREFTRDEFAAGTSAVLASAGLWRHHQATAASPDDRTLVVDGVPHTVVGVMPDGFEFPVSRVELWQPFVPASSTTRLTALGLLRPGVTIEQAQAAIGASRAGHDSRPFDLQIAPFVTVASTTASALRALLGAVALLLLTAVANAANIIQAQTVRRESELALRASLGASWLRIARQLVTESVLLAAIAAVTGVTIAAWTLTAVVTRVPYLMSFQALRPIGVDWRTLVVATGLAFLAGIGSACLAAVRVRRVDPQLSLRGQSFGTARQARIRAALSSAQVAITLVLLAGAGLLGNGFLRLSRADPGFVPADVVAVEVQLPTWQYDGEPPLRAALERLRLHAASLPDVIGATITNSVPPSLESRPLSGFTTEDAVLGSDAGFVSTGGVDDTFFQTLRIPLLAGRRFDDGIDPNGPPVAVVSRSLAERFWPHQTPVGRRFRETVTTPWLTVVGVVGDVRNGSFDQGLGPLAYYTARLQAASWWYEDLIVRTRPGAAHIVPALRAMIARELPEAPIVGVETGDDFIAGANGHVRFLTLLIITLAGLAATVALIGVYGTFSCIVSERTREIGVRLALGATAPEVCRMVLMSSGRWLAIGLAAGTLLSLAATRTLSAFLYEVAPNDPLTLSVVVVFLAAAAMGATYVPARRAAAVDPVQALRAQ